MSAASVLTVNSRVHDKWPTGAEHMLAVPEHPPSKFAKFRVSETMSAGGCAVSSGRGRCDVASSGTTIPIPEIAAGSSMDALPRRRGVLPPTSNGSSRRHEAVFACTNHALEHRSEPSAAASTRRLRSAQLRTTQRRRQLENYRDFRAPLFANILGPFSSGEGCSPAVGGTSPAQGAPEARKDKQKRRRPDSGGGVFVAVPVRS